VIVDRDGDFNFALLTCLPAVFALLLLTIELLAPRESSLGLVLVCLAVMVVFVGATAFFVVEQSEEDRFRAWLLSSVATIERGEARYGDIPILPNTELRCFEVPVGLFVLNFTVRLRPRIAQSEDLTRVIAAGTTCTLLTGWWSLLGPIQTLVLGYRNLRGGQRMTVAAYHAELIENGTASHFNRTQDEEYATRLSRPPWDRTEHGDARRRRDRPARPTRRRRSRDAATPGDRAEG
jgi:hypothetical protein